MNRSFASGSPLATAFAAILAASAQAGSVTGNPLGDGWRSDGNSLSNGTFVYVNNDTNISGDPENIGKAYDFDLYSTSFQLESGSGLLGNGWGGGDVIVGIGAMVHQTPNLQNTVRVLAKYGTSAAEFKPSTVAPNDTNPPSIPQIHPAPRPDIGASNLWGDGIGNSGASGVGGVIMDTPQIWGGMGRSPWFDATGEGEIILIDGSGRPDPNNANDGAAKVSRNGGGGSLNGLGIVKFIYELNDDTGLLSSFESYLNVTLLQKAYGVTPMPGDGYVIAIQNVGAEFTKATGTSPGLGTVPEPSSLVLASLGLGGLVVAVRGRARASA